MSLLRSCHFDDRKNLYFKLSLGETLRLVWVQEPVARMQEASVALQEVITALQRPSTLMQEPIS